MIMDNMWIEALKKKYRFEYKGLINVEDLFDLKLEDLDYIYKNLKRNENELQVDSLLDANKNPLKKEIENKINIVKAIFDMKEAEIESAKIAMANKVQRDKILAIIENKQVPNRQVPLKPAGSQSIRRFSGILTTGTICSVPSRSGQRAKPLQPPLSAYNGQPVRCSPPDNGFL